MTVFLLFLCFALFNQICNGDRPIPSYRLDLDLAPDQRWTHIVREYKQYYPAILNFTHKFIPEFLEPVVWKIAGAADFLFDKEYAEELRGISSAIDVPLGELVLINTIYDLSAFNRSESLLGCTSIIAESKDGQILHARNLDYTFKDLLENMTIRVEFVRDGKVEYSGITFAFYIGVLTGQRDGAFTVSLDERYDGSLLDNILMILFTRFHNPTTFAIRKALAEKLSFQDVVTYLSRVKLMAPSYLIIGGIKSGEGVVLARSRWTTHDAWFLNKTESWYLVETNFDHGSKPVDIRKRTAIKALNDLGQKELSVKTIYNVISIAPVKNSQTIYSVIMSAAQKNVMKKWSYIRE